MFVSRRLIYLQMQKTGSTHVTKVLRTFCDGKAGERHGQLMDIDRYRDRLILSSVRNPWDWYVSLWSFGCQGSGGLAKHLNALPYSELRHAVKNRELAGSAAAAFRLVSQAGRRPDWAALYADSGNEANFRQWLGLLLGREGLAIRKEGYAGSRIKTVAGFMTYRFLALTTAYQQWNKVGRRLDDYAGVAAFAERHAITNRILRMESLNEDLLDIMQSVGIDATIDDLEAIGKTNTSTHRKYSDYYDETSYQLVAERDRYIVERFGYEMF